MVPNTPYSGSIVFYTYLCFFTRRNFNTIADTDPTFISVGLFSYTLTLPVANYKNETCQRRTKDSNGRFSQLLILREF